MNLNLNVNTMVTRNAMNYWNYMEVTFSCIRFKEILPLMPLLGIYSHTAVELLQKQYHPTPNCYFEMYGKLSQEPICSHSAQYSFLKKIKLSFKMHTSLYFNTDVFVHVYYISKESTLSSVGTWENRYKTL